VKKISSLIALLIVSIFQAYAAAPGISGINRATGDVATFYQPLANLSLAIGALVGTVGGIRIFILWQKGQRDIEWEIMGWMGSCIFLVLLGGVTKLILS
jgi:hypothetical protein